MKEIIINPVEMTKEVMQKLEALSLIDCIYPSNKKHREKREIHGEKYIYQGNRDYGAHSLVFCSVDREEFSAFGHHNDNEDFLLLGGCDNEKDLYFMTALCDKDILNNKIKNHSLSADDFVCFKMKYNDPWLSFFVMRKNIPHGECTHGSGKSATFYVTEGNGIDLVKTEFGDYTLKINFSS